MITVYDCIELYSFTSTALKDIATDQEIESATGINILKFRDEVIKIQDLITRQLANLCPQFVPENNYVTQVATKPPTFAIFVNNPDFVHFSYLRYLNNQFRNAIDFTGTPIKLLLRKKA